MSENIYKCECYYDEVCPACRAMIEAEMAELEMQDANEAFDEAYPPEHWADMASFGDNGWD